MESIDAIKIEISAEDFIIISSSAIDKSHEFEKVQFDGIDLSICKKSEHGKIAYEQEDDYPLKLNEHTDYYFEINGNIKFTEQIENFRRIINNKKPVTGTLNFRNYIGLAELVEGVVVEVGISGEDGAMYKQMLDELTSSIINLAYHYLSPTNLFLQREESGKATPYEDYLFIKYLMQDHRFPTFFEIVRSNPNKMVKNEDYYCDISQVFEITPKNINDIFSSNKLIKAESTGILLQRQLNGMLPLQMMQTRKIAIFDTPENRLIKFFLKSLIRRIESLRSEINKEERDSDENQWYRRDIGSKVSKIKFDCKNWLNVLEDFSRSAFLEDVGDLKVFPSNSQVLQKQEGYREIFILYLEFSLAGVIKWENQDDLISIENKNMPLLYEYWVFFKIVEILRGDYEISDISDSIKVNDNFFTISIKKGNESKINFENGAQLFYNKRYSKSNAESYSVNLRPDITLEFEDKIIIFDAKYKFDIEAFKQNDDSNEEFEGKITDIYKMHTYRDAIIKAVIAIAIYPGTTIKLFDIQNGKLRNEFRENGHQCISKIISSQFESSSHQLFQGVGSIPLRPKIRD